MKKLYRLAVLAGLAGMLSMPAAAADVSYITVLSGSVVSVAPVGAAVKEGDVLLTVNSLAGPMPAARSDKDGVVKSVLVQPGSQVQQAPLSSWWKRNDEIHLDEKSLCFTAYDGPGLFDCGLFLSFGVFGTGSGIYERQ